MAQNVEVEPKRQPARKVKARTEAEGKKKQ